MISRIMKESKQKLVSSRVNNQHGNWSLRLSDRPPSCKWVPFSWATDRNIQHLRSVSLTRIIYLATPLADLFSFGGNSQERSIYSKSRMPHDGGRYTLISYWPLSIARMTTHLRGKEKLARKWDLDWQQRFPPGRRMFYIVVGRQKRYHLQMHL